MEIRDQRTAEKQKKKDYLNFCSLQNLKAKS